MGWPIRILVGLEKAGQGATPGRPEERFSRPVSGAGLEYPTQTPTRGGTDVRWTPAPVNAIEKSPSGLQSGIAGVHPPSYRPPVELAAADMDSTLELLGQQVSHCGLACRLYTGYQPDAPGHGRADTGDAPAVNGC